MKEGRSQPGWRINRRGCRVSKRWGQICRGRGGVQNGWWGWGGWVVGGRGWGRLQCRGGGIEANGRIPSCKMPRSVEQNLPRLLFRDAQVLQILLAQLLNILGCVIPVEDKHWGEVLEAHGGEEVGDALRPRDSSRRTCLHRPFLVWLLLCPHVNEFEVSLPAPASSSPDPSWPHPHHLDPVASSECKRLPIIRRRMAILQCNRLAHHPLLLPPHPPPCLHLHCLLIGVRPCTVQVVHRPAHFPAHSPLQPPLEGGHSPVGHTPPPRLANHPNMPHCCCWILLCGAMVWVLPLLPPAGALPQVHLLVLHGVKDGGCQLLAVHSTEQVRPPTDPLGHAPLPHKPTTLCEVDAPRPAPQHVWALPEEEERCPFWVRACPCTAARCFPDLSKVSSTLQRSPPPPCQRQPTLTWAPTTQFDQKTQNSRSSSKSTAAGSLINSVYPPLSRNVCGLLSCWRRDAESCSVPSTIGFSAHLSSSSAYPMPASWTFQGPHKCPLRHLMWPGFPYKNQTEEGSSKLSRPWHELMWRDDCGKEVTVSSGLVSNATKVPVINLVSNYLIFIK